MKASYFIVADRGNFRAYRTAAGAEGRPPRLELVQGLALTDAHLKAGEKFSDEAGGFPTQTGRGSQQMVGATPVGEKHYELEEGRRQAKLLGNCINDLLQGSEERWAFAAPADFLPSVLEEVQPTIRERLVEKVPRDLVNIPAQQVFEHFSSSVSGTDLNR